MPNTNLANNLLAASLEPTVVVEFPATAEPPHVTVVIATFNRRQMIVDALDALGRQSGGAFEVIVVDDGSTDETFEIVARRAQDLGLAGRAIRLCRNRGRSTARNVGVVLARAPIVAFTDSDCVPAPSWLETGFKRFSDARIGVVQGQVRPHPDQRRPFFSHFIEVKRFDGSFSTSNVFYRREAVLSAGGFDPDMSFGEDHDLGWRVRRIGWQGAFAPALVYHQVVPLSPFGWLRWPWYLRHEPAKAARFPEYRRFLVLGLWVSWFHLLFDLAVVSLFLGALVRRRLLALALPYLIAFPLHHGLGGRWPPVKAAFHLAWDVISFCALFVGGLRHRSPVL